MRGRLLFPVLLALSGCHDSLIVAEQGRDAGLGSTPADAAPREGDALPPVAVICGSARCTDRTVVAVGMTYAGFPCCADPARSACGVVEFATTCLPLNQPGRLEPSCPGISATPLGPLPGCCQPGNTCGVFEAQVGLGCTQVPFLSALSAQPSSCVY